MIDSERIVLVICLTLFIVIGVNAALYAYLRRGNEASQIDLLRQAGRQARQPWSSEDAELAELARQAAELRRAGLVETPGEEDSGTR